MPAFRYQFEIGDQVDRCVLRNRPEIEVAFLAESPWQQPVQPDAPLAVWNDVARQVARRHLEIAARGGAHDLARTRDAVADERILVALLRPQHLLDRFIER